MTASDQAPRPPADPHRSPLAAVLAAFSAGAVSTAEVRLRTGLDREVVDAAVEHLIRMGRLERSAVDLGCAREGCDTCPAGGAGATCGTAGHHGRGHGSGHRQGDASGHADPGEEIAAGRRLSGLHLRTRA